MTSKAIGLGSMMLSLVDPHPGHERTYNRWYEEDHLYATLLGPGALAGARYVARGKEKRLRPPGGGPDARRGSLLALYWLVGDGRDHDRWRPGNRQRLAEEGRLYAERDLVFGYTGRLRFTASRPAFPVPPTLALDHRFGHLVLSVVKPTPDTRVEELARAYRTVVVPSLLSADSPVALVVTFLADRQADPGQRGDGAHSSGTDLVVVWFCDADPTKEFDDLARLQSEGMGAAICWVSPFVAAVVGTDTYLDDLAETPSPV